MLFRWAMRSKDESSIWGSGVSQCCTLDERDQKNSTFAVGAEERLIAFLSSSSGEALLEPIYFHENRYCEVQW
jgi:hypothetical protein